MIYNLKGTNRNCFELHLDHNISYTKLKLEPDQNLFDRTFGPVRSDKFNLQYPYLDRV